MATTGECLLALLDVRFPGAVSPDVRQLIQEQDSLELLDKWFDVAMSVFSFDQFLEALRK